MTDHDDAVAALKRLGLSSYEAKVFVALQRIGRGTAREIDDVTDVPRSQVYGAAENLEKRGLIDVQRAEPIQYRAVDLDEARRRLRARIDDAEERAFGYLETARNELVDDDEAREEVWTIIGRDAITDRVVRLANEAERRVVFGTDDERLVTDEVVAALDGFPGTAVVVSTTPAVRERFEGIEGVVTPSVTTLAEMGPDDRSTRLLIVDGDTVLMAVRGEGTEDCTETAIWSANTGFASVFVGLFEEWLTEFLDG
ncbi:helix-turn-helix domain-containing protein [Halococcus sp. IIIV-5B]|uniref:TrmB family transcriptional regulator n=1 Tax=Halococcus sp. IIIV-5B TaxID=2321230 RepID=UPI00267D696A